MRSVKELKDIKGKVVLVRVDFNLPIKDGKVEDDFRIKKALPTIELLKKEDAKVVLIAHLGKGGESLEPVAKALNKYLKVKFVKDILGDLAQEAIRNMNSGEVVLLENLRNDVGEKECSKIFALNLVKFADFYVNEAFPVSHREDASLILLPKLLPAYAGLQLEEEIEHLSSAFKKPKHPFLFILGGAKFSTKMPLIEKYLELADCVFVGGALANDFLKASGYEVGKSLLDDEEYNIENVLKNKKLILPDDVVVESGDKLVNKKVSEVGKHETIVDMGAETVESLKPLIEAAKMILWNGPLGKSGKGDKATKEILKLISESNAESIIGGGETVALISELDMEDKFSFVSTGGGATLDFLANGTLPAIKALQ